MLFFLWRLEPDPREWLKFLETARGYLAARPWLLLASIAVLPGFGFPISPLLILLGASMGPTHGLPATCALGILAQAACSLWAYGAAVGPLRNIVSRLIFRQRDWPEITRENAFRVTLLVRLTPGIPFAVQNVALGLLGVRLRTYLGASIPPQALYAVGFIATSGAIFEGRTGIAITGVLLLICLGIATRVVLKRRRIHA